MNSLLDFLCWYNQHILQHVKVKDDGEDRRRFFQAVCAPLVREMSGVMTRIAKIQRETGYVYSRQIANDLSLYGSIDTRFTKINGAAKMAINALKMDVGKDTKREESVLWKHDPALYDACLAMWNPQRS